MDEKQIFMENIMALKEIAIAKNNFLTKSDIDEVFKEIKINEQQREVIYSYMKANNITVENYDGGEGIFEDLEEELRVEEEENKFVSMYKDELDELEEYSDEEIFDLYKKMLKDESVTEKFITANLKNVIKWIEPFEEKGESVGDLIGEANLSLVTAVNDLKNEKFESPEQLMEFLKEEIVEYINIYVNIEDESDSLGNIAVNRVNEVKETVDKLYVKLGRSVKIKEIAQEMGIDEETVLNIINISSNKIKNVEYPN